MSKPKDLKGYSGLAAIMWAEVTGLPISEWPDEPARQVEALRSAGIRVPPMK